MAGGVVSRSIQDSRRRVLVRRRQKNPAKERSSTELRFASFLFPIVWARRDLSRVSDERPTGALDSPRRASGGVLLFLLDNADVVIEGMIPKAAAIQASGSKRAMSAKVAK